MGQPRASRKKVVAVSSDEEDESGPVDAQSGRKSTQATDHSNGNSKSTTKPSGSHHPTPPTSTQEGGSQKSPPKIKPKASNTKSKPAVKDASKPNVKPIFSFFNAATQKQGLSQPSASPEKPPQPDELTEAIHDNSADDDLGPAFAKGSSTTLAMRKRKFQPSQTLEEDTTLAPPVTQKFRKTSDGGRTPSFGVVNEDKRPWIEQFAPTDLSELAVHKRKVGDVQQWLESAFNGRHNKVLVLKGAAGTGKTTTINLLAKAMDVGVVEWRNPAGADLAAEGSASAAAEFEDFVARAGKVAGLTLLTGDAIPLRPPTEEPDGGHEVHRSRRRQLLLVEEFPNTFSRTSGVLQSFRSAIMQYLSGQSVRNETVTPIVMVISETLLSTNTAAADSFTAHRLLGPELSTHPYVNIIEFNPVAPTILTKALEGIVIKEARISGRRKTPGPLVLKHLAETGDMRSAVSSLEFLCLRGDDDDTWSSKVTFTKPKKSKSEPDLTKSETEALKLITNRENSLGIFHSVGKVVYNKRVEPPDGCTVPQPGPWLQQHRRPKLPETHADSLMDELGTDISTYIAALHENYALSCASSSVDATLHSLNDCADNLSDADLLCTDRISFGMRAFSGSTTDTLRQDEMAFNVAVRGLLFSLPHPVHRSLPGDGRKSDAHRIFYPASLKLWKKREEVESALEVLISKAQTGSMYQTQAPCRAKPIGVAGGGVESWQSKSRLDQRSGAPASDRHDATGTDSISVARMDLLLDCLPFLALIWAARNATGSPVLDQILFVSNIRGSGQFEVNEEDQDADDGENAAVEPEQWSTDRQDSEVVRNKTAKPRLSGKHGKPAVEGGGLSMLAESRVEKLVLDDDDIVDD